MSSLGYQTIYREIHAHPGASAERAFLPDDVAAFRQSGTPLETYEGERPVSSFPVIAFSLSYELELSGVIECLVRAGLPPLARDRTAAHPLVVMGGPLTFSNPLELLVATILSAQCTDKRVNMVTPQLFKKYKVVMPSFQYLAQQDVNALVINVTPGKQDV